MDKFIIVYGNLSDGFAFYGPFDSFDEADEATSNGFNEHPTWIATVHPTETKEVTP